MSDIARLSKKQEAPPEREERMSQDDFGSVSLETIADTAGMLFIVAIMFAFGRNLYNILMNSISNVGSSIWAAFEGFGREIRKAGQWVGVQW
jgi:hypothetical protein